MKFELLELASWPTRTARLWLGVTPRLLNVFDTVQSVERFSFWLIAVIIEGSEFSGVIGVKPMNEPWKRLNEKRVLNARFRIRSSPANALPMMWSLTLLSKRCE